MANWVEITKLPDDEERQKAFLAGVGGYGGNEQDNEIIKQTSLPKDES